jgi:sulfur carrier protein
MRVIINGEGRDFPEFSLDSRLSDLVAVLGLKGDRVAIEHNGEISARAAWDAVELREGDKLEIVHFVGGGLV